MLYNELYYRHIYAHISTGLSVDDMVQSYSNYCALFNALISKFHLSFSLLCHEHL